MERDLRPLCAVCGRKVDMLECWHDLIKQGWTYVAHCHGQTERMVIPDCDLVQGGGPTTLSRGTAFGAKKLGHQAPPAPASDG